MLSELQTLSQYKRLQVAGEMAPGIAEIFCHRVVLLIQDWEDRNNSQVPVLDDDLLVGMVQETMAEFFSELMKVSLSFYFFMKRCYQQFSCIGFVVNSQHFVLDV